MQVERFFYFLIELLERLEYLGARYVGWIARMLFCHHADAGIRDCMYIPTGNTGHNILGSLTHSYRFCIVRIYVCFIVRI